mmetsp:Transcript_19937/g.25457  ORF Transcript_19937/g.25457 Transcript_19937/m.25457 type:complete len:181 (+) Transcript_19937:180-722(+)
MEHVAKAAEQAECTFKPRTNQVPVSNKIFDFSRTETIVPIIEQRRQEKENKLEQLRREKEYKELKECTFVPLTNEGTPVRGNGPVIVRGLGRHLELKEMARRQEEEQKQREDKAFGKVTNRVDSRTEPYTIPKPFNLSTSHRRRKSRSKSRDQDFAKDLTFSPETLSRSRQRKILGILAK